MSEAIQLPYYSRRLDRPEITDDTKYGQELVDLLTDERITEEAKAGNLTVAMIRPRVGPEANLRGLPDAECAEVIEEMIDGLGIAAKFSFKFPPGIVSVFYSGAPQEVMEKAEPLDTESFDSRWPEFVEFMASGATTVLLLHSPEGNAIEKWREHLGHWNIDKYRDPSTIRGVLGVNLFNNLVHGSDSPESAAREINLIRKAIEG